MKKGILVALVALVGLGGFAYADKGLNLEPIMDKGTMDATAGLELGWGVGIGGGVEYIFGRVDLGDVFPITFGAAARGYFSSWAGYTFLDVGGMGTLHVGLKGLRNLDTPPDLQRWLDNFDYYIGLGIGLSLLGTDYWYDRSPINFASMSGVSYFLNDNLALTAEGGYMGYWSYGLLAVTFKF